MHFPSRLLMTTLLGLITVLFIGCSHDTTYISEEKPVTTSIHNFDECIAAGFAVLKSYPRQCRTPDGQTFRENRIPPEQNTSH